MLAVVISVVAVISTISLHVQPAAALPLAAQAVHAPMTAAAHARVFRGRRAVPEEHSAQGALATVLYALGQDPNATPGGGDDNQGLMPAATPMFVQTGSEHVDVLNVTHVQLQQTYLGQVKSW